MAYPRRWYQVHLLSVAFVLSLVGVFVLANLHCHEADCPEYTEMENELRFCPSYGWPLVYEQDHDHNHTNDSEYLFDDWLPVALEWNILIGAVAVCVAGLFCEWWLRRRERSRGGSTAPCPSRFKFHLSTAIVLSLLVGVLFWLNFRYQCWVARKDLASTGRVTPVALLVEQGFPFTAYDGMAAYMAGGYSVVTTRPNRNGFVAVDEVTVEAEAEHIPEPIVGDVAWRPTGVALNAMFALALLAVVALLWEARVRRLSERR
jgi:hypothetical protein